MGSPSLGHPDTRHWDSRTPDIGTPGPQTLGLPYTMEQFLEWGRTSPWAPVITLLGVASCLRIFFGVILSLRDLLWAYVLPRIWPVDLVKTYGKWAVVTGCTGGIGKAYVLAMAARGMDIVLVGRSMEKLQALEREVKQKLSTLPPSTTCTPSLSP